MSKTTYVGPRPQISAQQHRAIGDNYESFARIRCQVAKLYLDCANGDPKINAQAEKLVREAIDDRDTAEIHLKLAQIAKF